MFSFIELQKLSTPFCQPFPYINNTENTSGPKIPDVVTKMKNSKNSDDD